MSLIVGMFVHNLNDRGIARVVRQISLGLARAGVDTSIICTERSVDVPPVVRVVEVPGPATSKVGTLLAVSRALKSLDVDVLFAHGDGPARDALLSRMLGRVDARLIVVSHIHYRTHSLRLGWVKRLLVRWLYPKADVVAGVSPGVVEDLVEQCPALDGKTMVLPNPGPEVRDEGSVGTPGHSWFDDGSIDVIIGVGHHNRRKAHDTTLRAFREVNRSRPSSRLLILGAPDDYGFTAELEGYVDREGLGSMVEFLFDVTDVIPYLAASDLFVHAARSEAFGLVVLEAMASGVPVVAADAPGGISWILGEGRFGKLVPVDDHAAMAKAMMEILESPTERETLILSGRRRAEDFSLENVIKLYGQAAKS